jgi:hypothetical protein
MSQEELNLTLNYGRILRLFRRGMINLDEMIERADEAQEFFQKQMRIKRFVSSSKTLSMIRA